MDSTRGGAYQEIPDDFARTLRELNAAAPGDPALNVVLAAARSKRWRTPVLAAALGMNPSAVSKRIERARARAGDEDVEALAAAAGYVVPEPVLVHAMIDGRRLSPEAIAALRRSQQIASKVNGGVSAGRGNRRTSEAFSAELYRLTTVEGFSAYYLAAVLGISHRAVTSRLERHGMRTPCPSVAGTASGVYSGRKIGDPGQGVPRVTREQRAELRALWQAYAEKKRGARSALATKLREYLEAEFTLANLARTMSSRDVRVRYGALQHLLAADHEPAEANS